MVAANLVIIAWICCRRFVVFLLNRRTRDYRSCVARAEHLQSEIEVGFRARALAIQRRECVPLPRGRVVKLKFRLIVLAAERSGDVDAICRASGRRASDRA